LPALIQISRLLTTWKCLQLSPLHTSCGQGNLLFSPLFSEREPRSRSLHTIARPSVVCNVRAPYSGGWNFRQYFYGLRYLGQPLTSTEKFTEIVPGEPLRRGELNTTGVTKYSDFRPIDGYISETVQYSR